MEQCLIPRNPLRTLTLMATPHGPAAEPSPDPHARVPPRETQDGSPGPRTRGASARAGGRRRASLSVFAHLPAPEPDPRTSARTREALVDLRRLCLCLFAQMLEHLWLAEQLVHAGPDEENALRTWECTGQILQRMELSTSQQFHASMAVSNYASGMGERWDHASAQDFPFLHSVLGEFRRHDDRAEYAAGLDLLLSGIERQTWAGRPAR